MNVPSHNARWLRILAFAICLLLNGNLSAESDSAPGWRLDSTSKEKCQLSSAKMTMFDGYQKSNIQLHITAERIYLRSMAPIDNNFDGNGFQVEADSPEARQQLLRAEKELETYATYAGVDMDALEAEMRAVSDDLEKIQDNKWFQDYKRNPINAARLDEELADAMERLAPLEKQRDGLLAYNAAQQAKAQAQVTLSRLPQFPLVTSSNLEQRKTLHFGQPPAALIESFKQGSAIRIQLRFWPTWPATGTHEAKLSLAGFNEALGPFQNCVGQG